MGLPFKLRVRSVILAGTRWTYLHRARRFEPLRCRRVRPNQNRPEPEFTSRIFLSRKELAAAGVCRKVGLFGLLVSRW